jgi:hypothetical protein
MSEYCRKFTVVCLRLVGTLRFNSLGYKMDLMKQVLEAVHLVDEKGVPGEILKPIVENVERLKRFKFDE